MSGYPVNFTIRNYLYPENFTTWAFLSNGDLIFVHFTFSGYIRSTTIMILLTFVHQTLLLPTLFVLYGTTFNKIVQATGINTAKYTKSTLTCHEKKDIGLMPLGLCAFRCIQSNKLCLGIGYSNKCELCYHSHDSPTSLTFSSGVTTYSVNADNFQKDLLKGKYNYVLLPVTGILEGDFGWCYQFTFNTASVNLRIQYMYAEVQWCTLRWCKRIELLIFFFGASSRNVPICN